MVDTKDIEDYWAEFRKPYVPQDPKEEAEQPIEDSRFTQEELEQGLLAIRALRAERRLAPGNPTPRLRPAVSPAEIADLNRALRAGLGLPRLRSTGMSAAGTKMTGWSTRSTAISCAQRRSRTTGGSKF